MQPLLSIYQKRVSDHYRIVYHLDSPIIKCSYNNHCNNDFSIIPKAFEDVTGTCRVMCKSCASHYRNFFKVIPIQEIIAYLNSINSACYDYREESNNYRNCSFSLHSEMYSSVNYDTLEYYKQYVEHKTNFFKSSRMTWVIACLNLGFTMPV